MEWIGRFWKVTRRFLVLLLLVLVLGGSTRPPEDIGSRARAFTRQVEFDYVSWIINALSVKWNQAALRTDTYLSGAQRRQITLDYLNLVSEVRQKEAELNLIFADPEVSDPLAASAGLRLELEELHRQQNILQPVAEEVLQSQVAEVAAEMELTLGGQPVPPVLYHATPLPYALIVSPRDVIRQEADISLVPELGIERHVELEERVDGELNVSSLVVSIGGVGVYPTMVRETGNLEWLSEVVAHEWVHNFLTLRPLGVNYFSSPALRTMNETAANIAGKEIGLRVLERFYPELVPPPETTGGRAMQAEAPLFDFNAEMRQTRIRVDELLAQGEVEAAEAYMEERRLVFWENGYRHLRKLNQAYFAFHGAYADAPGGGAAGEDPVGAAVRQLRAQSPTLADFLNRISWMYSFEQLQREVGSLSP